MEAGLILGIFVMIVFIMGLRKHRKSGSIFDYEKERMKEQEHSRQIGGLDKKS